MVNSDGDSSDPTAHWMVGKKVHGGVVVSVSETRSDYGPKHYRIKREVKLSNGAKYWKESVLVKEKANPKDQEEEFDKRAKEEAAKKDDIRARARAEAQKLMKQSKSQNNVNSEDDPKKKKDDEENAGKKEKRENLLQKSLDWIKSPSPIGKKKGGTGKVSGISPPLSASPVAKGKAPLGLSLIHI